MGIEPNEGLLDLLAYMIKSPISGVMAWDCLLWVNDLVPDQNTVLANLVEASFTGYARFSLTRATWTNPVLDVNDAVSDWGTVPFIWTNTGSTTQTVYGWAAVDPILNLIRGVQRLEKCDITPLIPGGQFSLLPRWRKRGTIC